MDMMTLLSVAGMFLLTALSMSVALFFLQRYMFPDLTPMQERLNELKTLQSETDAKFSGIPTKAGSRLLKGSLYENEKFGRFLEKYSFTSQLRKALLQAGMKTPVDKFMMTFFVVPFIAGFVLFILLKNIMMLIGGIGVFAVAIVMVKMRQKARLAKLTAQLPDALNLITSSLRAGHSFQAAMTIVCKELPDPISTEFSQVVSDINFGIPVKDALGKMLANLETLPDIRMFVTSLIIQRETGGNLAEILDKLSYTIRERFKLQGQIKALTGQARLTGYILGCAPLGLFTFLYIFMNKYLTPLITTDMGKLALVVAAIMQGIGFFVMKKIIEIRV